MHENDNDNIMITIIIIEELRARSAPAEHHG